MNDKIVFKSDSKNPKFAMCYNKSQKILEKYDSQHPESTQHIEKESSCIFYGKLLAESALRSTTEYVHFFKSI